MNHADEQKQKISNLLAMGLHEGVIDDVIGGWLRRPSSRQLGHFAQTKFTVTMLDGTKFKFTIKEAK